MNIEADSEEAAQKQALWKLTETMKADDFIVWPIGPLPEPQETD